MVILWLWLPCKFYIAGKCD